MTTKVKRKIVCIDESKCDGCGNCVPSCAEGALQIINGKARLVKEIYCDGLGACLGECPQGAITIIDREAEEFDDEATREHIKKMTASASAQPVKKEHSESLPCGCPSTMVHDFREPPAAQTEHRPETVKIPSALRQWPIQLKLVPPTAPFLQGADLLLAADCVPFAMANFHQEFLKDKALLIGCPKLDDNRSALDRLTDIIKLANLKSLTVLHMEVPCCFGLVNLARQALTDSGKQIPFNQVTIGIKGDVTNK
ncbi:MAG: 4Fe-4S dicluster domain-containing protein [Planctomycetota bacterium]